MPNAIIVYNCLVSYFFPILSRKISELFPIAIFKNQPCEAGDGSEEPGGVFYSPWECSERGGQERGNCASGFGRCCVIKNIKNR
jgi:hypothetical protein